MPEKEVNGTSFWLVGTIVLVGAIGFALVPCSPFMLLPFVFLRSVSSWYERQVWPFAAMS